MVLIYFRTAALIVIKAEKDLIKFKRDFKMYNVKLFTDLTAILKFLEFIIDRSLNIGEL